MKRTFTLALAAAATFTAASPAQAALVKTTDCQLTQVSPTADACSGWWAGNLMSGQADTLDDVKTALAQLGYDWDKMTIIQTISPNSDTNILDFTGMLSGKTIIGLHRGGNGKNGDPGQASAFFSWNNIASTDSVTLNISGLSTHTLYIMGVVPEPSTWLLMIAGVGLVGWQLRRRRQTVKVSFA